MWALFVNSKDFVFHFRKLHATVRKLRLPSLRVICVMLGQVSVFAYLMALSEGILPPKVIIPR